MKELKNELESASNVFISLVDKLSKKDLSKGSHNRGWNNGEILFHMLFGYLILNALIPIVFLFGSLPRSYSKVFVNILNLFTPVFNFINGIGARGGAKVFYGKRLINLSDKIFGSLLKKIKSFGEKDLQKGMHFPTRWDSLFKDYMTLEDVFNYTKRHFIFHCKQLNV